MGELEKLVGCEAQVRWERLRVGRSKGPRGERLWVWCRVSLRLLVW